jgi:hypothetical protein
MCNRGVIPAESAARYDISGGRQAAFWLALSAVVVACATLAAGQSAENSSTPPQPHHAKKLTLDDQVQKLAKSLDLNETQQSEVKGILEKQQDSVRRLREQGSSAGTDWVSRLHAIHAQTITQIRAILNDEQRKKYDAFVQPQTQSPSTPANVDDWLKPAKPK